jgi:hypothetical protein
VKRYLFPVRQRPGKEPEPDLVVLPPEVYEELRTLLDIQPARVKDSRGAHFEA